MQGNLLSRPQPSSPEDAESDAALDYRQKIEHDLMQKISTTLDPLLGHERYRASMSVDLDLTSGEQNEETVDPAKSVMLQSQKTEEMIGGSTSGGVPGTASNLPRPAARTGSGVSTTRRTENITWQPSRVTRTTKLPQGALKRMSVALVLDQAVKWEGTGKSVHRVLVPPSPETLKSVKDVVTAAIGFVPERGDLITVQTLPFEETLNQPPPETTSSKPSPANQDPLKNLTKLPLAVLIGAGAVILLLVVGVLFLLKRKSGAKSASADLSETQKALHGSAEAHALEAADAQAQIEAQMADREEEQRKADLAALASIKVPPVKTKKGEVLAKQIRETTKKDSAATANILQAWIHDR